jgi:hypothetical protein
MAAGRTLSVTIVGDTKDLETGLLPRKGGT